MAKNRTFIAVELPTPVLRRAGDLIEKLRDTPASVTWLDDVSMHWTLKFLGNVPIRDIPSICNVVSKAVAKIPAFEIPVGGPARYGDH